MVDSSDRVPIEPQSIIAPLSRAAVFLVLSIGSAPEAIRRVRSVIADIGADVETNISCRDELRIEIKLLLVLAAPTLVAALATARFVRLLGSR